MQPSAARLACSLLVLSAFALPAAASAAAIDRFAFTSDPQSIGVDTASGTITAEAEDAGGNAVNGNTVCLEVTSSSRTGEFATSNSSWGATPVRALALTLSTKEYRRNFYYRDSTAGSATLTLAAGLRGDLPSCASWTPDGASWTATQNITIGGGMSASVSPSAVAAGAATADGNSSATAANANVAAGPATAPQIFASAGPARTVFVGADAAFTAMAVGLDGAPLTNARYVWAFGDGGRAEGQGVSYHYDYPGTYVVVLDVASGGYSAEARATVTALPAEISIPFVSSAVTEIQNNSSAELDLGGWILAANGKTFTFPPHTVLGAHEAVMIANARTGLSPKTPEDLALEYPNGTFAASYQVPLVAARMPAGTSGAAAPAAEALSATPQPATAPTRPTAAAASQSVLNASQTAAVVQAADPPAAAKAAAGGANTLLPWIAGLALLIALGAGGLYFFMGDGAPAANAKTEDDASAYAIEEIQ